MSRHQIKIKSQSHLDVVIGNDPGTGYLFGQIIDTSKEEDSDEYIVLMKNYLNIKELKNDMKPYFLLTKEIVDSLMAEKLGTVDIQKFKNWDTKGEFNSP